ncbi:MAG TPA: serine hydrolase [Dehalococcoidia bacterium]|nr:serine hydrolase [Dehalococcoidia bacterium]
MALLAMALVAIPALACASGEKELPPEPTPQLLVGTPPPVVSTSAAEAADEDGQQGKPAGQQVSLDWLVQPGDPPALPAFASPVEDAGLMSAVEGALDGATGRVSVVVRNLQDGRSAAVNEREVYYAASTFKLGILYEAFRQRDMRLLDFGRVLTLEQKYADEDLGTLQLLNLHAGDTLTVLDAVRAMIIVSDTPTAVLMQDTVGGQTADATLRTLGVVDTSFNSRELPATAADMVTLLEAIAGGSGVSGESRVEMLSLLLQESYRDGVEGGVPEGTALAHKTGSYSNATHDVALVWGPAGPYVIAVMTDQQSNWPLIADVSKAVWDYFAASP